MTDLRALWDFDDPAGSEARFRELAEASAEPLRSRALTQVARALGLQERYADGHAVLDGLACADDEVAVRLALERGRLLRSAGADGAAARFAEAAARAGDAGLEELQVDALHMAALVVDPDEQVAAHLAALEVARAAHDPRARDWDAALLNNLGMCQADAGDFAAALASFEEALTARRRIGEDRPTRVATWMVAWALRNLGETDRARSLQLALQAELDSVGETDPYVEEELALLAGEDPTRR